MHKSAFLAAVFLLITASVFAEDMTLDFNGNVGIGTITPTSKLEVFTTTGDAIVGTSSSGWAGYFDGDMRITGDLTVDGTTSISGFNSSQKSLKAL